MQSWPLGDSGYVHIALVALLLAFGTTHPRFSQGPQLKFERITGVARCTVGYSGGKQPGPTYQRIKDHTESLLVEYNPEMIRYEELLVKWARMAFPYAKAKSQYRNAIFYTNFDQQAIAEEAFGKIREQGTAKGIRVYVDIEPVTKFYQAEDYHQKFLIRRGA